MLRRHNKFCSPCPYAIKSDGSTQQQVACCPQKQIRHVSPLSNLSDSCSAYTPVPAPHSIKVPTHILILSLVSNLWILKMRCLFFRFCMRSAFLPMWLPEGKVCGISVHLVKLAWNLKRGNQT